MADRFAAAAVDFLAKMPVKVGMDDARTSTCVMRFLLSSVSQKTNVSMVAVVVSLVLMVCHRPAGK